MTSHDLDHLFQRPSAAVPKVDEIRRYIQANTKPARPMPGMLVVMATFSVVTAVLIGSLGMTGWLALPAAAAFTILTGLILAACWCSLMVTRSMRPGAGRLYSSLSLAVALAVYEAVTTLTVHAHATSRFWQRGGTCLLLGTLCGCVAALPLWLLARRAFVVDPASAGMLAGLTAGLSGVMVLTFHCNVMAAQHTAIWHAGVLVVCSLVGRAAASLLRPR